jgi:hypothetical protein
MKRTGTWLLGLALAGTGCVGLPPLGEEAKPAPPPAQAAPPPPPVLPGAVDAGNVKQVMNQLNEELDRAKAEAPPAPDVVKP